MTATRTNPLLAAMTEEQLLAAVRDAARLTGWTAYHTRNSRGSDPGFPDLVLIHPGQHRVLSRELKTEGGRLTGQQQTWLDSIAAAGGNAGVWRPRHLADRTILRDLQGRWNPTEAADDG